MSGNAIGREGLRVARGAARLGARAAARAPSSEITGGIVTELAHDGDAARARGARPRSGERLGFGLVGLVNTFNPEVIVIGGGAVRGGDLLLEPAREVVGRARAAADARGGARSCPPTSATRRG